VSRIHRRDPRGDWSLETDYGYGYQPGGYQPLFAYTAAPVFRLSMLMTRERVYDLMDTGVNSHRVAGGGTAYVYRGAPSITYGITYGNFLSVRDIEVTVDEANRMVNGEHPLDVLFGEPWPDCGYKLKVVPAELA